METSGPRWPDPAPVPSNPVIDHRARKPRSARRRPAASSWRPPYVDGPTGHVGPTTRRNGWDPNDRYAGALPPPEHDEWYGDWNDVLHPPAPTNPGRAAQGAGWTLLALGVLGVLAIALTAIFAVERDDDIRAVGIPATARVVSANDSSTTLQYQGTSGLTRASGVPDDSLSVGSDVAVLVDPDDPERLVLADGAFDSTALVATAALGLVVGPLGLVLGLALIGAAARSRRKAQRRARPAVTGPIRPGEVNPTTFWV